MLQNIQELCILDAFESSKITTFNSIALPAISQMFKNISIEWNFILKVSIDSNILLFKLTTKWV